jgi:hypothetical protein
MPIFSILCDHLLENFTQRLIKCLCQAIFLRIITRRIISYDFIFCNKSLHLAGFESLGVVGGDLTRNSKVIYDMSL